MFFLGSVARLYRLENSLKIAWSESLDKSTIETDGFFLFECLKISFESEQVRLEEGFYLF